LPTVCGKDLVKNNFPKEVWLVPKLQLGNHYLPSSCLVVLRKAGASKPPFPSGSLGTSNKEVIFGHILNIAWKEKKHSKRAILRGNYAKRIV